MLRLDASYFEIVRLDSPTDDTLRFSVTCKIVNSPGKSGDRLENSATVLLDVEKIGRRKRVLIVFVRRISADHSNQLMRFLHPRQGVKQNGVNHAENSRVGADAESQREDGDQGKRRLLHQTAQSMAQLLVEGIHALDY